jgi:hypothetical protein
MRITRLFSALAVTAALGLLAGCDTYHSAMDYVFSDKDAVCPDAVVLAGASVLPAFDPRQGDDPSVIVYAAGFSKVDTSCGVNKRANTSNSRIYVSFHATRPNGGHEAVYRVPYFVATTTGGHILDKKMYWQDVTFAEGALSADASATLDDFAITATRRRRPADYHFIVGFQLTKTQRDYNEKTGHYEP